MPRLLTLRSFVGVIATVLVAACGGGGGGPSGPGIPVIAAGTPPSGLTGTAYAGYAFSVASGGTAPFQWTATGTMPPGLALDAGGHLSGTPATAGTYPNITINAADSSTPALTGHLVISLTIADSTIVVNAAPTPPAGIATNPYVGYTFTASGGSPPYTWRVTPNSGALPGGLALASDGTLSGTPKAVGPFAFSVTATDSAQTPTTGVQPFTITINAPAALAITPGQTPPAGVHGTPYSFTFTASGGYLPLTWMVPLGTPPPPPGLALDPNGTLSGTPTTPSATPYKFTVTVTDSSLPTPVTKSLDYSITISDPLPPTINNNAPPPATVGTAYQFQFSASAGLAPLRWNVTQSNELSMSGLGVGIDGLLSGTPSTAGHFPITVGVMDALTRPAPPATFTVRISQARPAITFTATGSMRIARSGHTATLLLPNAGKTLVLVAGGPDNSAELYDPATGMFTDTGSMTKTRVNHAATLLNVNDHTLSNYGKVLIVGPADASAELYDPALRTFTATGSMTTARTEPVATLLATGKVLVVGGNTTAGDLTAELYDPASGTFTATGPMTTARTRPTATLLNTGPNAGKVLVTGGNGTTPTLTAELYDPASGKFAVTGSMTIARAGHVATLLQDGTVLVVGTEATADLYDPTAGTFTSLGNAFPVFRAISHTASLRSDHGVLITGADNIRLLVNAHRDPVTQVCVRSLFPGKYLDSSPVAALFAPESEAFMLAGDVAPPAGPPRDSGHTATVLPDGATVLMVGGTQHTVGATGDPRCRSPFQVATPLSSAVLIK